MPYVAKVRQPGDENHRRVTDGKEDPLTRGIGHAPAWPARERNRPSLTGGEVNHLQLGTVLLVTDARGHREMRLGNDRDTVWSRRGSEPRLLLERRGIQPHEFRRAAVGHQNLPSIGDHPRRLEMVATFVSVSERLGEVLR